MNYPEIPDDSSWYEHLRVQNLRREYLSFINTFSQTIHLQQYLIILDRFVSKNTSR
jgi:hypothetical protein